MGQRGGTMARQSVSDRHTQPGDAPARTVRRHRGLPGSRAVVGGLLVAAAAVGLFAAATRDSGGPRHSFVVARRDLAAGARLQASDLAVVPMDLAPELRARAFSSASPLVGTTLLAPLGQGELVQASAVVTRPGDAAGRELTFTLERGRVGSGIKDGERVDLLGTFGTGVDAFTVVVVRQALLVGIDRARTSAGDTGPATVSVSIDDPADAVALAHAVQLAKITLVRATGAPPLAGVPPTYRLAKS